MAFGSWNLPGFLASGDIYPRRFAVNSGVRTLAQASNATTRPWGITKDFNRYPPGYPGDDSKHAVSGEPVSLNPPFTIAALDVGSGGLTAGDKVVSDGSGKGITAASTGTALQWVGAIALQTAVEGDKCDVWTVEAYPHRAALS